MPIQTSPPLSEVQSRAQSFLRDKEPTRDDILRARGFTQDNIQTNRLVDQGSLPGSQRETTPQIPKVESDALKSAVDATKAVGGDLSAAQSQAKIFASAMTAGVSGRDTGTFSTREDINKAKNVRDNMLAQLTSQMLTDPLPALMSNLQGEGSPNGKNIFENYMAELATAGITDPRNKLRLMNEFKSDVDKRVSEVKGEFFNKQNTQMFLLQAAQNKVKDTNDSFKLGLATEADLKKSKMEAERHEADLKLINANIRKISAASAAGGSGSLSPSAANREKYKSFQQILDDNQGDGTAVLEWIKKNVETKKQDAYVTLFEDYQLKTEDEKAILLGLPPETDTPKPQSFLDRLFGSGDDNVDLRQTVATPGIDLGTSFSEEGFTDKLAAGRKAMEEKRAAEKIERIRKAGESAKGIQGGGAGFNIGLN